MGYICAFRYSLSFCAENAADVAEKLANFTRNGLSDDEVGLHGVYDHAPPRKDEADLCSAHSPQISHVVTKVQQLVNVAKIDAAVAESVVSIISNVMTSSEAVLGNASNMYVLPSGLWGLNL